MQFNSFEERRNYILDARRKKVTLYKLGSELGVTGERVRQIAKGYKCSTVKRNEIYTRARIIRHLLNKGMKPRQITEVFNKTGSYAATIIKRHLKHEYVMKG